MSLPCPTSVAAVEINVGTPKFIFPYLDNLETFFEYAWGDAAFRFLRAEIEDHLGFCKARKKEKKYMGGCIVGLMAWVYERVPMLGEPRVLHCFPRLFKWGESKIPVNPKRAEVALKAVRANKDDIDVSSIGKSAVEESLQEFRGREDYSGHDQLSTEHRNIIETYLCGDTLGGVVWQDDIVILYGHELLLCLFGEWLRSDVIHTYFNILSNDKHKHGQEIYCMSPNVQINVIAMMEKTKQKKLKDNDFSELTSKLDKSTLSKLSELDTELLQRCKHLLFPIDYRSHWTLLVYTTSNQCFSLRDSISGAVYKGAAKKFAKFLSGYLWNVKKCDIGKSEVIGMKCRQQENDANCGVYVCLWAECFARDNPEFWNVELETSIEGYRSQIAATILSDERGLLKGLN